MKGLYEMFVCFLVGIVFSTSLVAQRKCVTYEYNNYKHQRNAILSLKDAELLPLKIVQDADDTTIFVIPIVVHVIHNSSAAAPGGADNSNISDIQILSQIEVLNEDFRRKMGTPGFNDLAVGADVKMEFKLALDDPQGNPTTGINRIYHPNSVWQYGDEHIFKALSYWPSEHYLNFWIVNLNNTNLGYATTPYGSGYEDLEETDPGDRMDGVVIDFTAFGRIGASAKDYSQGRTSTHEIGHWLGLQHTWGDEFCGTDYIEDTPVQEGPNFSCTQKNSNCEGIVTADMIKNYMNYTPDLCMNIFTKEQKVRMRNVLLNSPKRRSIVASQVRDSIITAATHYPKNDKLKIIKVNEDYFLIGSSELHENLEVDCIDVLGNNIVFEKSLVDNHTLGLRFTNLPSGMFFLKISGGTRNELVKFHNH